METIVLSWVDTIGKVVISAAFTGMTAVSCWHYVKRTYYGEREDTEKLYAHMMKDKSKYLKSKGGK